MSVKRVGCHLVPILFLISANSFAAERLSPPLNVNGPRMHNIVDTNTLGEDYNEEKLLESKTQESLLKITSPRAQPLSEEKIEKGVSGYTRKPLINLEPNDFPKRDENLHELLRNKIPHLRIGIGELDIANDQELDRPIESLNSFDWQRVFLKGQAEAIFSSKRAPMNNNDPFTSRDPMSESVEEMNEFGEGIDSAILPVRARRSQDLGFLLQFLMDNGNRISSGKSIIIRNPRNENTNQSLSVDENDSIQKQNTTATGSNLEGRRFFRSLRDIDFLPTPVMMEKRLKRQICFTPDPNSREDQLKAYVIQNMKLLPMNQGGPDMFAQFQQMYDELRGKAMDEYNAKNHGK